MVISLRKYLRTLRLIVVFCALTYLLYKMIGLFGVFLFPADKYRIPDGAAVKAFHIERSNSMGLEYMADRLKLFYWYGE
ncbi:DUF4227 family protein [Paenibacillus fonticola]|uniref:DUF4227 family protein n=1 Tax=Paenibacillus fonticola TaxID=379896 RepID=UPI0003610785|nr:DUF4227 family protein [Paenibacillus fonticola]